jgi:signal peptidase
MNQKHEKRSHFCLYVFGGTALFTFGFLSVLFLSKLEIPNPTKFSLPKLPRALIVTSGSMEPTIKTGSVIIAYPSETYLAGEIVTFAPHGDFKNLLTHRIEYKTYPEGLNKNPIYLTSGDANKNFDQEPVKNADIRGKVVLTIPYLGYFADFAKKPQGYILLVVIPATIIIYEEIKNLAGELKKLISKIIRMENRAQTLPKWIGSKSNPIPKVAIAIPLFGAFLITTYFSSSYFFDKETSLENALSAAISFASPTPFASPTSIPPGQGPSGPAAISSSTPTPTPTESPVKSPTPSESPTP